MKIGLSLMDTRTHFSGRSPRAGCSSLFLAQIDGRLKALGGVPIASGSSWSKKKKKEKRQVRVFVSSGWEGTRGTKLIEGQRLKRRLGGAARPNLQLACALGARFFPPHPAF